MTDELTRLLDELALKIWDELVLTLPKESDPVCEFARRLQAEWQRIEAGKVEPVAQVTGLSFWDTPFIAPLNGYKAHIGDLLYADWKASRPHLYPPTQEEQNAAGQEYEKWLIEKDSPAVYVWKGSEFCKVLWTNDTQEALKFSNEKAARLFFNLAIDNKDGVRICAHMFLQNSATAAPDATPLIISTALRKHREQWSGDRHHGLTFGDINELVEALAAELDASERQRNALQAQLVQAEQDGMVRVPKEPTEEMITAYLTANDAYWNETDKIPAPLSKWRVGTPREATAAGYRAMLAAAMKEPPHEQ